MRIPPFDDLAGKLLSLLPGFVDAGVRIPADTDTGRITDFGPLALQFIREKLIDAGHVRKTVNDRIACIVKFFQWLSINELCHVDIYRALDAVPGLEAGKTKAPDNPKVLPVSNDAVEATLPHLPPIVADMVRVQRLCGMRPQDVYNMRFCDIERTGDVWTYRPFTHKTEHFGKTLAKAIGPKAQTILTPYLFDKADSPEAFLFSPADTLRLQRAEKRARRKTRVQPSQVNRKKPTPKRTPKEQYTADSYRRAIERACDKAGVPRWAPNQLRHAAGTTTTAQFSLEAAKEFLGHASVKTTEQYYVAPLPELAAKVAREIG